MNDERVNERICVEYDLPHPPAKVWRALTEPKLVAAWLMANDIEPVVGHRFTFTAKPMGDWDGRVDCEILEADAPKKLRYSWRGGPANSRLDSEVSWTLTPSEKGTLLALVHSGFLPIHTFAFEAMSKGWRKMLEEGISNAIQQNL
jgi:uncharacterized protein YndB with AHSA1/START domain